MLKRILVVGDKPILRTPPVQPDGQPIRIDHITDSETVPLGTTLLIADKKNLPDLGGLCSLLGERSDHMFALLAEAIDCREDFLRGSSLRVLEHAARFGAALELSEEDQQLLEYAALLRDIGKLRIPNALLLKASLLTYDEWLVLQHHAHFGGDILREINGFEAVSDIVANHHECYDGDGYPDKLEKDAIPYLSRALLILDVYCAMTSPRHYREGYATHEAAIDYIRGERGKHFDPLMVDTFILAGVGQPWKTMNTLEKK